MMEKKVKVATGLAGLVAASGLVGFLIYRYRKYKKENAYCDNAIESDDAWR